MLSLLEHQRLEDRPWRYETPVSGLTVFTDAGKRSKRTACTWQQSKLWKQHVIFGEVKDMLQTLELKAVIWVFENWNDEAINIVSDLLYVVSSVQRLERAVLKEVSNRHLYSLLSPLLRTLNQRQQEYFITHVRGHQNLPGLSEGNARADQLVAAVWPMSTSDKFQQACFFTSICKNAG